MKKLLFLISILIVGCEMSPKYDMIDNQNPVTRSWNTAVVVNCKTGFTYEVFDDFLLIGLESNQDTLLMETFISLKTGKITRSIVGFSYNMPENIYNDNYIILYDKVLLLY